MPVGKQTNHASLYGIDLTSPAPLSLGSFKPPAGMDGNIYKSIMDGTNAANAANNVRYNQGLGVLTGGLNQSRGMLDSARQDSNQGYGQAQGFISNAIANSAGIGQSARNRVRQQYRNDIGKTEQNAISRGLGNTTIRNSMLDQDKRRKNDSMADIDEQVANRLSQLNLQQAQTAAAQGQSSAQIRSQMAGNEQRGAGSIADFIGARNDVAPDLGMFSSLVQNAAADSSDAQRTGTVIRRSGSTSFNTPIFSSSQGSLPSSSSSSYSGGGSGSSAYSGPLYFQGNGSGPISSAIMPGGGGAGVPSSNYSQTMADAGYGKGSISIQSSALAKANREIAEEKKKYSILSDSARNDIYRKHGLGPGGKPLKS